MKRWLAAAGILGLAFLAGQLAAWRQLVNSGVYLPTTLQSGFFYILTGLHGLHLLGGVVALGVVLGKALNNRLTAFNYEPLRLCALYWHVMDGLWVYLVFVAVVVLSKGDRNGFDHKLNNNGYLLPTGAAANRPSAHHGASS